MDPDAYFKRIVPPDTRPGAWRWVHTLGMLGEVAIYYAHDLPLLAQMPALFWQEPLGVENTQHVVKELAHSWNPQEDQQVVESLPEDVT